MMEAHSTLMNGAQEVATTYGVRLRNARIPFLLQLICSTCRHGRLPSLLHGPNLTLATCSSNEQPMMMQPFSLEVER